MVSSLRQLDAPREQAQARVEQYLIRASRFSRTALLLPELLLFQASFSRLALDRPLPVCAYLDLNNMAQIGEVDWVSPDFFQLLLSRFIPRRPLAQYLCLETPSLGRPCNQYRMLPLSSALSRR